MGGLGTPQYRERFQYKVLAPAVKNWRNRVPPGIYVSPVEVVHRLCLNLDSAFCRKAKSGESPLVY